MEWDGKRRQWHCSSSLRRGCGVYTLEWLRRHACDKDELDHAHRLLVTEVPIELVAECTGLPLESVQHIKESNYDAETQSQG